MTGQLQNADFKTEAQLVSAGATKADLLNDTKVYMSTLNETLDDAVLKGLIGGKDSDTIALVSASGIALADIDLKGQNASFDGGGTITASSLSISTTASELVFGTSVIKYSPAANGQNDYFGFTKDIPKGVRGNDIGFQFWYKNDSSAVNNEFRFAVKIKDGAQAGSIQYTNLEAASVIGKKLGIYFNCPADCTQVEFGFQNTVTRTTIQLFTDNILVSCSPFIYKNLFNVTEPKAYTPSFNGLGTVTNVNFRSWREGAYLSFEGTFTTGTTTASEARIGLGFDGISDNVFIASDYPTGVQMIGYTQIGNTASINDASGGLAVVATAGQIYMKFTERSSGTSGLVPVNGSTGFASGVTFSLFGRVKIEGWKAYSENTIVNGIGDVGNFDVPDCNALWATSGNTLPTASTGSVLYKDENYIYLFGGYNGSATTNVIQRASVNTPTVFTNVGTLPSVMGWGHLAVIGDYVYIFGGCTSYTSFTNKIWRAPKTNIVSGWVDTGSTISYSKQNGQLAIIGDKVYIFGGYGGSGTTNNISYASLSNPLSWSNAGVGLPTAVDSSHLAVIEGYIYLFGGTTTGTSASIWKCPVTDPINGWLAAGPSLAVATYAASLVIAGGYVYLIGGNVSYNVQRAPLHSPLKWESLGSILPRANAYACTLVLNDIVYQYGGVDGTRQTIYSTTVKSKCKKIRSYPNYAYDIGNYAVGGGIAYKSAMQKLGYAEWTNDIARADYDANLNAVPNNTMLFALPNSKENVLSANIDGINNVLFNKNTDWISSITKGGTGYYTINFKAGVFSVAPAITCDGYDNTYTVICNVIGISSTYAQINISKRSDGVSIDIPRISIVATKLGVDYTPAGVYVGQVAPYRTAYLKDVKSANTDGGSSTGGSWQTRTLNTIEGDTSIVSLSSNQFTLQNGTYLIKALVPSHFSDRNKAKLRNITDSIDSIIGSSSFHQSSSNTSGITQLTGTITISGAKTFEIQHYTQTGNSGNGLGIATNFGVSEIYTTVEITKLY